PHSLPASPTSASPTPSAPASPTSASHTPSAPATPTSASSPRSEEADKESGPPREVPPEDKSRQDRSEPAPPNGAGRGAAGYVTGLSARLRPRWPRSGTDSTANATPTPATQSEPSRADQQPPKTAAQSKPVESDAPGIEPEPQAKPSRLAVTGAAIGVRLKRIGAALLIIVVQDR